MSLVYKGKKEAVKALGKPLRQSSLYEDSSSILVLQWLSLCGFHWLNNFNKRLEQEREVDRKPLNPLLSVCFHLTQYSVGSLHKEHSDFF